MGRRKHVFVLGLAAVAAGALAVATSVSARPGAKIKAAWIHVGVV